MKIGHFLSKNVRRILSGLVAFVFLLAASGAAAAPGALDPTFGTNGSVRTDLGGNNDQGLMVIQQADGKILMSGLQRQDTTSTPVIVRFNVAGGIDPTFGVNGKLVSPTNVAMGTRIALQPDGKLIVAGAINGMLGVLRFDSNGTVLDNSFGTSGAVLVGDGGGFSRYGVSDIAIEADGKIVLVGTETNLGNFTNIVILRLNSDGTFFESDFSNGLLILDKTNFPNNRYNNGRGVAVQADGKIVISGHMMDDDANEQITLARLNADGSLDTGSFGTNGKGTVMAPLNFFSNSSGALSIQSDGKIVVAGSIVPDNGVNPNMAIARFNTDGSLDTTFGGTGIVVTDLGKNEYANGLALQSDGKLIVAGISSDASTSDFLIARYKANGALDSTFGVNGVTTSDFGSTSDAAQGVIVQSDGRILAVGSSSGDALLARYDTVSSSQVVTTSKFNSIGNFDGWILESGEFTSKGGILNRLATVVNVGDDVADRQYRAILSFNTISLPDNAVITGAQVKVKRQGAVGQDPFNTHGSLLLETRLGLFSNGISLQLTDFAAVASPGEIPDVVTPLALNWYGSTLSNSNKLLVNRLGVTQFRLRFTLDDNDDKGADYVRFFSGESVDANRPQLIISYYLP